MLPQGRRHWRPTPRFGDTDREPDGFAGPDAGIAFELLSRLDVGPGRYRRQLAAENAVRGRRGTAHYDVDAPDIGGLPLSVSGLVLSTGQVAAAAAAKDKLVPLIPVVPTVQRDFVSVDLYGPGIGRGRNSVGIVPLALYSRVDCVPRRT
jgi:hypothetical protein